MTRGPALGVLEVSTIARGVVTADAGLKRAPAILLHSRAVSGGKHLVFFEGGVAEVEEAMGAGKWIAGDLLLDYAGRLLRLVDEAAGAVIDLRDIRKGRVLIGANEAGVHAVLPVIGAFQQRHPEIVVEVRRIRQEKGLAVE